MIGQCKGVSETGQKCGGHEHLLPLQLSSHAQAAFLTELAVQTPPVHKDAGFPAWCLKRAIRLNDVVRAEQQGAVPDKVIVVYVYYVVRGSDGNGARTSGLTSGRPAQSLNVWR